MEILGCWHEQMGAIMEHDAVPQGKCADLKANSKFIKQVYSKKRYQ